MSIYLGEQLIAGLAASERITLQLGDTQVVTFPFKPAIDGIISISTTQEAGTSVYITFSDSTTGTGVGSLNGVMQTQTSGVGTTGYMSNMFVVRAGANVTVYNPKNLSFNATFTPFIPTTGEPVKQTYDPTSVEPISGAGVAAALSTLREGYVPIEIKVGETQSGKPVYRQSYVMNGLSFNNVGNVNIGGFVHNLSQMESVERISGVLNRYREGEPLFSQSVPNNQWTAIRFTRNGGSNSLVLTATSWAVPSGYSLRDSFITLEYTKLTD